jgi:hypothetical protein
MRLAAPKHSPGRRSGTANGNAGPRRTSHDDQRRTPDFAGPRKGGQTTKNPLKEQQRDDSPLEEDEDFEEEDDETVEDEE